MVCQRAGNQLRVTGEIGGKTTKKHWISITPLFSAIRRWSCGISHKPGRRKSISGFWNRAGYQNTKCSLLIEALKQSSLMANLLKPSGQAGDYQVGNLSCTSRPTGIENRTEFISKQMYQKGNTQNWLRESQP